MEFEPHSVWYEASYTIAAQAIRAGLRTDYHVFQHEPADVVDALTRLGVNVGRARRQGLFRLLDSYTVQSGLQRAALEEPYGFVSISLRLKEWKRAAHRVLADSGERDIVHIDDNDSLLATANTEDEILDFFHSRAFAAARSKRITFLHGFATGVHPEPFYRRLEAFVDGILDFAAWEREGQLDQVARERVARGTTVDSRWRLLTVAREGEVRIRGVTRRAAESPREERRSNDRPETAPHTKADAPLTPGAVRILEFLREAFAGDSAGKVRGNEDAGWRSLVQIARGLGLSPSSLYPRSGSANRAIRELELLGLVEARSSSGSRGRGGVVTKLRASPEVGHG